MPKKLSAWNVFVKKVYSEGKAKNKSYQFRDALKDASKRKSEMGSTGSTGATKKQTKRRKGGRKGGKSKTQKRSR